ncbi:hypothetical protein WYY_18854 [Bacillus velezensis M27]|nr:hypothetical protein WYY_18854 [Bacillus velezensis M27]
MMLKVAAYPAKQGWAYVKKQQKTKKLAEKTSFSLQAEGRYPAFFTLFGPGF